MRTRNHNWHTIGLFLIGGYCFSCSSPQMATDANTDDSSTIDRVDTGSLPDRPDSQDTTTPLDIVDINNRESSTDAMDTSNTDSSDVVVPVDIVDIVDISDVPDAGNVFGLDTRPANTTCQSFARGTNAISLVQVFGNLTFNLPLIITQAPSDRSRFFVVEKGGRVRVFPNVPNPTAATLFVDIAARVNSTPNEAGLLGMAFDPNFATNRRVYLSYTASTTTPGAVLESRISRFVSRDNGATLDPTSEEILLRVNQPFTNHNGGNIAFGPDGFLYIGFGDGGSAGDPQNNGQNNNALLGKILRIDVNNGTPYGIPSDNPFAQGGGRAEIFATGVRNPWRFSFDRATGLLWAGDVGQNALEEVDIIRRGNNMGWNVWEGNRCFGTTTCSATGFTMPIAVYPRSEGQSITGGYVYNGRAIPELVSSYIYADFVTGRVWSLSTTNPSPTPNLLFDANFNISSFGEDIDGELYALSYSGTGRVYQLRATTTTPSGAPMLLSATGCVNPTDPRQPATGVIPYNVNMALWSDGAEKERYLALPDNTQIHVNPDGDWDLPVGTVLIKTFVVNGRYVETRLLVRHADGDWAGYSYAWNDAQTDATLLSGSQTRDLGTQTWYYPDRAECLRCHTTAAGRTLGLETSQLNRTILYPSTNRTANQLATLEHIGMFDAPINGGAGQPTLPTLTGSDPIQERARSYLHANCSFCHRPSGPGLGNMDMRFTTPFANQGLCNATPNQGDLGVAGARIVSPTAPARSVLSLRVHATGQNRMPPLASSVVDTMGTQLIDAWITGLNTCP